MEVSVFIKETHFAQLFRFLAHNSGLPCLILTRFSPLKRPALQMLDDILPFLDFNTLLQSRSCSKATCWSVEQIKTFEDRYAEMLQKMNKVPDEVEDNHSEEERILSEQAEEKRRARSRSVARGRIKAAKRQRGCLNPSSNSSTS